MAGSADLLPGESRGYWKRHSPGKWFRQAKIAGKINNLKAILLLDSGAEVSILDTAFARKVGCHIDTSQNQDCVGIGENVYTTEGRTRIKITLAGYLVYFFDIWVGDLSGQEAILGMDFMVPAGIRLDLAFGSVCLPDEVKIQLSGRRQLYSDKSRQLRVEKDLWMDVGESIELPMRLKTLDREKLWVTRGDRWVPTIVHGPGKTRYLRVTNVREKRAVLDRYAQVGMWLLDERVPRIPGFVSVGSRRYMEWQNLALQATVEFPPEQPQVDMKSMAERPTYPTPRKLLQRESKVVNPGHSNSDLGVPGGDPSGPPAILQVTVNLEADRCVGSDGTNSSGSLDRASLVVVSGTDLDATDRISTKIGQDGNVLQPTEAPNDREASDPVPQDPDLVSNEGSVEDDQVCYHEGGELNVEDVRDQMAVLPEVTSTTDEMMIEDLQVGDPRINTPEEIDRLRRLIWKKRHLLIGKGNALPPAAKGAICDIDVGNAKPVTQRVRKVAPQFREKLSDLIKGLLAAKIIQPSRSSWASPIVVIIKKNGVDIRRCIDYRLVNSLTKLMVYPMPLINDLLEDLDKVLWYCSLDMTSGFWVVSMTDRARLISAFITPFGLFEWLRMPFGLKNAPQIYQRLLDNALYGFVKISKTNPTDPAVDLFVEGEPESPGKPSILGRRSYIDDILVAAKSWDQLCGRVEDLLEACDEWNLSISVVKSFWGLQKVDYLGHQVSGQGLEARPKDLSALVDLPFPGSLRSMQSFLGSLNYYSRFMEDYAIYAAILYELREIDFAELSRDGVRDRIQALVDKDSTDPTIDRRDPDPDVRDSASSDDRWLRAGRAFDALKHRIVTAPILRHFDSDLPPVVIVYASEWAISAALVQEHDQVYYPVLFTSRTLKSNEINYNVVEKEILALLHMLDLGFNMLVGRRVKILTWHSTLAWLFRSPGLQGRLGQWAAILSPWTLEITKSSKGEDEILGVLAASITPRSSVDEALAAIAPKKEPKRKIQVPIPVIQAEEELLVVSFDGSARVKRGESAYSAILWKLPEWAVVEARSSFSEGLTVNEAEYNGFLLGLDLLRGRDPTRLVICGDSNLVIRQVRGEIDCKAPGLTLLKQKVMDRLRKWPDHELVHVKRDWNASADSLASAALQQEQGTIVDGEAKIQDLVTLNRLDEILSPQLESPVARIMPFVTRSNVRSGSSPPALQEEVVRGLRIDRIRQAQEEEAWIRDFKKYLNRDLVDLTQDEATAYSKIATDYEVDDQDLLFYCPLIGDLTWIETD